eukprot:TRINITY_DN3127_c0_g3_i3.p1 TRINITY_DN3127_c0_g3~~TRINITY_DN3127_c0_g3_i3.p1  ORF type:complete len:608 (-),score=45.67 TRINITY_DN3127_c0_g3_i3:490-2055(-)
MGEVYDVTSGSFYAHGGGYDFFVGRDASRAFITGDFQNDLNDNVSDFDPGKSKGLVEWRDFYRTHETYTFVGVVEGLFYDKQGKELELLHKVEKLAKVAEQWDKEKKELEQVIPNCNKKWSAKEGGEVSCSDGKYPRLITETYGENQTRERCGCFDKPGWSDTRKLYDDCNPPSSRCHLQSSSRTHIYYSTFSRPVISKILIFLRLQIVISQQCACLIILFSVFYQIQHESFNIRVYYQWNKCWSSDICYQPYRCSESEVVVGFLLWCGYAWLGRSYLEIASCSLTIPTTVDLVRSEGFMGLMKGQSAAVARAVLYGGLRLGLYTPLKQTMISEGKSSNFAVKLAAGTVSGAIAAGIANPFDLIKTRQQAQGGVTVNPMKILKEVVSKEGVLGLWKGTIPSSTRAAVLTASQCATYDEVKGLVKRVSGMEESLNMHLLCSMITGVVTTTATAPVDMVKTHMFVGGNKFASPIDCTIEIVRAEGMKGLFKGWLANYARLGPQTAIIFVVAEQLRQIAGLGTL